MILAKFCSLFRKLITNVLAAEDVFKVHPGALAREPLIEDLGEPMGATLDGSSVDHPTHWRRAELALPCLHLGCDALHELHLHEGGGRWDQKRVAAARSGNV